MVPVSSLSSPENQTTVSFTDVINHKPAAPVNKGAVDKNTTFNGLGDLKAKAPEVYAKMLEGLAMNVISEARKHQRRLKEAMKKMNAK